MGPDVMEEPKISIIIPVYNAEQYLKQCLDSIMNQTYRNLQIICVDDESKDQSYQMLLDYKVNDPRITVLQQQNSGVSATRNRGLQAADGDYLLFVDSDDWIELDTCQRALDAALQYNADVVMWSYVRETGKESRPKQIFNHDIIFNQNDVQSKLHRRMIGINGEELSQPENADALCTVWGKLYRRTIITDHQVEFFDIRKIGTYEDGLFNLQVFENVQKAVFLNQFLYHYRRNVQTSVTGQYNPKLKEQWDYLFEIMRNYISEHNLSTEYLSALNNRITLSLIPLGINEMYRQTGGGEKRKAIKSLISNAQYVQAISTLNLSVLPLHWKVYFTCARCKSAMGVYLLLTVIQKIRGS